MLPRWYYDSKPLQWMAFVTVIGGIIMAFGYILNGPWMDITPRNPPAGHVSILGGTHPMASLPPPATPTPYYMQPAPPHIKPTKRAKPPKHTTTRRRLNQDSRGWPNPAQPRHPAN